MATQRKRSARSGKRGTARTKPAAQRAHAPRGARVEGHHERERKASFFKRNGLSLVLAMIFALSMLGQALAGHAHENDERLEHDEPPQTLVDYVGSGQFVSSTFENWESEFLQMGMFVLMTVWLYQRGSAESRPLDPVEEKEIEALEREYYEDPPPKAATRGGFVTKLYENSLALALFALFAISFVLHWIGSWRTHVEEAARHGDPAHSLGAHLGDAQFWFESFQNWQSEFLSVFALVVLSIWLRQKESPQSKPVDAPHSATGR
jgi:hypothetical protein